MFGENYFRAGALLAKDVLKSLSESQELCLLVNELSYISSSLMALPARWKHGQDSWLPLNTGTGMKPGCG